MSQFNKMEEYLRLFMMANAVTYKNDKGEEHDMISMEAVGKLAAMFGHKIAVLTEALQTVMEQLSGTKKDYALAMLGATDFSNQLAQFIPLAVGDKVEILNESGEVVEKLSVEGNEDFLYVTLSDDSTMLVGVHGLQLDLPLIRKHEVTD